LINFRSKVLTSAVDDGYAVDVIFLDFLPRPLISCLTKSRVGHVALKSASLQAFFCAATQTLVFKSAIALFAL
jgi:hypothetical protein